MKLAIFNVSLLFLWLCLNCRNTLITKIIMQESNEMMIYFDLFLAITSSGIVYSVAGSCQYCFCKLIPPCWRLVPNFTTSSNQKSVFPYIPVWLNLCPTSRPTSIPRHWRCRREHRCQSPSPLLRAFSSSPFAKISAYGSTVQSKRLLCGYGIYPCNVCRFESY